MLNKNENQLVESIKQVLNLYKIDIDESLSHGAADTNDLDFTSIMELTQKRIDELDKQTNEILKRAGMTEAEMEVFSANPDNFSSDEWIALEGVKQACKEYQEETEVLLSSIEQAIYDQPQDKKAKKTIANKKNKKKNWIQL